MALTAYRQHLFHRAGDESDTEVSNPMPPHVHASLSLPVASPVASTPTATTCASSSSTLSTTSSTQRWQTLCPPCAGGGRPPPVLQRFDPRNLPALLPSPHRCCNGSSEETSLHCCPPYPNMCGHMLAFTKLLMLTLLLCKDTITTLRKVEA